MLKDNILNMLKKHSLSESLIYEIFSSSQETKNALEELISEGKIIRTRKEFTTPEALKLVKGTIVAIKDRFSFASIEGQDDDVFISNSSLNSAFKGDVVFLKKVPSHYRDEYEVFSIIKRARKTVCGELKSFYGQWILDVTEVANKETIFMVNPTQEKLFEGYIALGVVTKQKRETTYVDIVQIIGNKNDPGVDISQIILSNDAPISFPNEVREQLKKIPSYVTEDEIKGREDFRDHLIVTIDGDDAKDFDDAVEVKRVGTNYEVGVHIADVAHYVKEGTPIDQEALNRGTSIYVADRVVPMLPFELSNGICSLNEGVDRLVTSCIFTVDKEGNITNSKIVKGVIKSHGRLTYKYVNKLLHHEPLDKHFSSEIDDMLFLLNEVSLKIRQRRRAQGALELESTELKFICNEEGNPIEVIKRKQEEGEELIEDLMISANEVVSETIFRKRLPFIYRIHEQPKSKKMDAFMKLSTHLGFITSFSSLNVTPKELSVHMQKAKDDERYAILSMMLLKSLAKARYSIENKGHFGLASSCYTHFTSPIRRYPDLIVHRLIDRYLVQNNCDIDQLFVENLDFIAENSSVKERRAITIERAVDDLMACKFLKDKIGNKFLGFIDGMTQNGMFIQLDEYGIDGFVSFDDLDDYYIFDERYMSARGGRTSHYFELGDKVEVIVSSVNLTNRQITFTLIQDTKSRKHISRQEKRKKKGERKNGTRN
ncbi:MAG: ribonuclease R [Bacilli bacterium]